MGILITIAVVGVSRHIRDSRKDSYVATAKSYLSSALNHVNAERLEMFDEGVTYYLPEKCVPMEKARKSPNGDFKEAYVAVTYDKKDSFKYYWMSRDNIDEGFYLTKGDLLEKALVQHSMEELKPNIGIGSRTKIMVLNDNCNFEGVTQLTAEIMMTGDSLTAEDLNNPITPISIQRMIADPNTIWQGVNKESIASIIVVNHKNVPSNVFRSWDISVNRDGSAYAWLIENTTSEGDSYYQLYMGGEGGVIANPNSYRLFSGCKNLTSLNLASFNTLKVTDMQSMFSGCSSLLNLNLSNFNTSNVTNMSSMFSRCSGLISLDLCNFNTSNVTNMSFMFSSCKNLTSLDLTSFNTINVTNIDYMFNGLSNINVLNIRNFDMGNVTSGIYWMFNNFPLSGRIEAGNQATKDKILERYPSLNVVLV